MFFESRENYRIILGIYVIRSKLACVDRVSILTPLKLIYF